MMNKGTKLYSIINNKCPQCHEGDFFINPNTFSLKNFSKMHSNCPVCGLSFEQEPGYYFGAMYFSYALNVAVMVAFWVAYILLASDSFSIWWMVFASIIGGLMFTPLMFRWSRLMWINLFIKYDSSHLIRSKSK
jgi:uncharacterized protein (DUF983 family)